MDNLGFSQIVLYMALYSFIGWVVEVIVCSFEAKKFVNRGFFYGPYCPIYGVGAIIIILIAQPLSRNPALVFLVSLLSTTALEYVTGWLMEQLYQIRWWDYSNRRFNLHGRVCLTNSLIFGAMGLAVARLHPLVQGMVERLGGDAVRLLSSLLVVGFLADLLFTLNSLLKLSDRLKALQAEYASEGMPQLLHRLNAGGGREFRLLRSFPKLSFKRQKAAPMGRPGFYKLFWVFLSASVLGFVLETLYCFVASGEITSRQGLLYGPFNQIYGFGAVLMVLVLPRLAPKSDHWLFINGAMLGGAFEYASSLIQEKVFHATSWGYPGPLSIGGRTNLIYMAFWGILAYVFIKDVYPRLSALIDRIAKRQGWFFSWVLIVLLAADMLLSGAAVLRWYGRQTQPQPDNAYEAFLDTQYSDAAMEEIYPSATLIRRP